MREEGEGEWVVYGDIEFNVKMFGKKPAVGGGGEELIYLPLNTFILFLGETWGQRGGDWI